MNRKTILITASIFILISAACALPFTIITKEDQIASQVQQTVQALAIERTLSAQPTWTPLPTLMPLPTFAPPATATAAQVVYPTATPQPCNQAAFISETVPDGSKFDPNTAFTKSWRIKNIGTCTWNPNYKLIFYSGDQMSGPASVSLDQYVAPGEKIDILVKLKSPAAPGTYTGYWRLKASDGSKFSQVFVQIKVPSVFFAVTSARIKSTPADFNGVCPTTVSISADITASTAGKVTYKWQRSDGFTSPLKALTFKNKGTKTIQFDWELNSTDTHWVKIYIDAPNHQWFGPVEIPVTCTP